MIHTVRTQKYRRHVLKTGLYGCTLAVVSACLFGTPSSSFAQGKFPSQPITIVVGFPPGGSNDIVARVIAPKLSSILGVPVIVENRAGANATVGTDYVVRSKPDGYTLTLGSASPLAISPHTYKNLPYTPLKDLVTVNTVASTPEGIAVHPSVPAKNMAELVALSKKQDITMASAGGGGLPHLAIELLKNESGGRFVHVPYKGATPAVVDTAGGHVNGVIMDLPVLIPMIKDGRLRGLAVADVQRAELTPDLPTTKEVGLPGVLAFNWFALMAPVKTPAPIVERLHAAVVEAANSPDVKKKLIDVGIAPLTQPTVKAANDFMQSETEKWGKVAKGAGVTAN